MNCQSKLADVIYRGTRADSSEVALRLRLPAEHATVADCWEQLCAAHGRVDPRSIEIEVRDRARA